MIKITHKELCCGCNACVQRCPKHCITMREDNEGFLYPKIELDYCIECGLCEKVCPIINPKAKRMPLEVYAAKNKNEEIRLQSSSGGIFTLLAETVIKEAGVVFGACFDEKWEVKHDYSETIEGLAAFRGSKYVQSRIEDTYKKAEDFLKKGRKVLFSGTPCQIAGLKSYLNKEYTNLLTVDFICHGVPSPKVWRIYLDEIWKQILEEGGKNSVSSVLANGGRNSCIEAISFRNKNLGWKKFSFHLKLNSNFIKGGKNTEGLFEPFQENIFMKAFLADLILRPSCHQCQLKNSNNESDITLADFWRVWDSHPDFYDDKGVSLLLINSRKAVSAFQEIETSTEYKKSNINDVFNYQKAFRFSAPTHLNRSFFFIQLNANKEPLKTIIYRNLKYKIHIKLLLKIKNIWRKLD